MPPAAGDARAEPPVLHSTRLPPAANAALRDTPEDPEAGTGELRDALDELRATLETPLNGATDGVRRRHRLPLRVPGRPGMPPPDAVPEPPPAPGPAPAEAPDPAK